MSKSMGGGNYVHPNKTKQGGGVSRGDIVLHSPDISKNIGLDKQKFSA